jgi:hypothetical protein
VDNLKKIISLTNRQAKKDLPFKADLIAALKGK